MNNVLHTAQTHTHMASYPHNKVYIHVYTCTVMYLYPSPIPLTHTYTHTHTHTHTHTLHLPPLITNYMYLIRCNESHDYNLSPDPSHDYHLTSHKTTHVHIPHNRGFALMSFPLSVIESKQKYMEQPAILKNV